MIFCLDTSCLAKLYVEEEDSSLVREHLERADAVFSSVIAYSEMRGAIRRQRVEGSLSGASVLRAIRRFDKDWAAMGRITVTDDIADNAGDLAEVHSLRGMDAIHLATAVMVRRETGASFPEVRFLTADSRLAEAARKEKFLLLRDWVGAGRGTGYARRCRWSRPEVEGVISRPKRALSSAVRASRS